MASTKILIAYVHDRPGVLTKIASIFYRRNMNIRTLTVGNTSAPEISKIVFRVYGEAEELNRLMLSVDNLIDVISIDIYDDNATTARELCLVRVHLGPERNDDPLLVAIGEFGARVLSRNAATVVLEMVGSPDRIDTFIAALAHFQIIDLSRTGATAMPAHVPVVQVQAHAEPRQSNHLQTLVMNMPKLHEEQQK